MKCSKFFRPEKLAPTCSDTVLGHRITQGAQNYFLTFSPVMFQSTPKEKCCLWGLFSGCNSECRLLRKTYLRAMDRRKYFHGISVIFPLYCKKDKCEQISNLIWSYSAQKFCYVAGEQHKFSKLSKSVRPACLMSCHWWRKKKSVF